MMDGYRTILVEDKGPVCTIRFNRPQAGNTINSTLIVEMLDALDEAQRAAQTIIVLEGSPGVFCLGADFQEAGEDRSSADADPEPLYALWQRLAAGPFISVAHVRGKVNAGGVGFVAACDIAVAASEARFSLSELLFGLIPACVMPFLVRRVGFQKAHYLTMMTQAIGAEQAAAWGLVDAHGASSEDLLRRHLLRLRPLARPAIERYKRFMSAVEPLPAAARDVALATNREVFSDQANLAAIRRFVTTGAMPWETEADHVR